MVDIGMLMVQDKAASLVKEARAKERKVKANGMAWRREYQSRLDAIKRANRETPELPNKIAGLRRSIEAERNNLPDRLVEQQTAGDRLKSLRDDHDKAVKENAKREAVIRELDDQLREHLDPYFRERQALRTNAYKFYTLEQLSERFRNDTLDPLVSAAEKVAGEDISQDEVPGGIADTAVLKKTVMSMWGWLERLYPSEAFWKREN